MKVMMVYLFQGSVIKKFCVAIFKVVCMYSLNENLYKIKLDVLDFKYANFMDHVVFLYVGLEPKTSNIIKGQNVNVQFIL